MVKSNKELHQNQEDLETAVRKRRLNFLRGIIRMNPGSLNKQIIDKLWNMRSMSNNLKQMEEDFLRIGLKKKDCYDRNNLRIIIFNAKVLVIGKWKTGRK